MMSKSQLRIHVMILEYLCIDGTDIILLKFMRTPSVLLIKKQIHKKKSDSVKSTHVFLAHHFSLSLTT